MARAVFHGILASVVLVTALMPPLRTFAVSSWNPTLIVNTESFQHIDAGDGTTDVDLRFGSSSSTLTLLTDGTFRFNKSLSVLGGISGSYLTIDHQANISGSLVVKGNAAVHGNLSGSSFFGAGLGDCNNETTSKLLYNSTTGKFSCGTDETGEGGGGISYTDASGIFVKKSGDTMTGGLIIDVGGNGGQTIGAGLALEVAGTASGEHLHFGRLLTGSGFVRIRNIIDSTTSFQIMDADGGNPVFNVDTTNERVGIGTASPSYPLDVSGNARLTGDLYLDGGDLYTSIFASRSGGNSYFVIDYDNNGTGEEFRFAKDSSGDPSDGNTLLTIKDSGNVGIGTVSPTTKLEVVGTASGEHLHFGRLLTGSGYVKIQNIVDSTTAFQILDADGGNPVFNVDTTNERVGIGTASPGNLFALNQAANATASSQVTYGFGQYNQGTINTTIGSDASYSYIQSWASKPLQINNQGNNTLLNVNTANVGIGTTSPSTKLEVVGTASGTALFGYDINNSKSATSGSVLVSRTTGQPEWKDPAGAMTWYLHGDIATGTNQSATIIMPFGMTLTDVDLVAKTGPSGSSLIVDINENGTTIFSTRPEIDSGQTREDNNHAFSDTTLAAGSAITIDIDQVGSSTAGNGLTIMLKGRRHY